MTSKTGDADTFRAAAEGKVRVEGMVPYLQWFTDGVKLVMGQGVGGDKGGLSWRLKAVILSHGI